MRKTCPGQMPGARAKAAPGIARRIAEMQTGTVPCAGSQSGTTCLPAGRPLFKGLPGRASCPGAS